MLRHKFTFFVEGGFAHFLKHLEGLYLLSRLTHRDIDIVMDHHKALGYLPIEELLSPLDSKTGTEFRRSHVPTKLPKIRNLPAGDYEETFKRSVEEPPLRIKLSDQDLWVRKDILTTGYFLPPGPRFFFVTHDFQVTQFVAEKVAEVVGPFRNKVEKAVGIHLRGNDRVMNTDRMKRAVSRKLSHSGFDEVFICSDDEDLIADFKSQFPNVIVQSLRRPFPMGKGAKNLHLGVSDDDAVEQLIFALADIFLLSKCKSFVPAYDSHTQWTHLVRALRTKRGSTLLNPVEDLLKK